MNRVPQPYCLSCPTFAAMSRSRERLPIPILAQVAAGLGHWIRKLIGWDLAACFAGRSRHCPRNYLTVALLENTPGAAQLNSRERPRNLLVPPPLVRDTGTHPVPGAARTSRQVSYVTSE